MEDALNMPPFPPLEWDDWAWVGSIRLGAWAGFRSRRGPYASADSAAPSDGSADLCVMTLDEARVLPSPEQAAACRHLREHQEATRDAILAAVFAAYPALQERYGYEGEDAALMPDLAGPDQLRALIGLSGVHCFPVARDGVAYVGFEFGCAWDGEHGLGAMTHAGRVVEVGGADTAILEWIAAQDAEKGA